MVLRFEGLLAALLSAPLLGAPFAALLTARLEAPFAAHFAARLAALLAALLEARRAALLAAPWEHYRQRCCKQVPQHCLHRFWGRVLQRLLQHTSASRSISVWARFGSVCYSTNAGFQEDAEMPFQGSNLRRWIQGSEC